MATETSGYLRVELINEELQLTLQDLCQDCGVHAETVIELVEHGVLLPKGASPGHWQFVGQDLLRIKRALRLQRDLAVNLAGVALTLDLLDEIDDLNRQLKQAGPSPD